MKKTYSILALLSISLLLAQASTPASPYYDGFNWNLTGTALKNALATKISTTHTNLLSYTPGIWNALIINDLDSKNLIMYY